MMLFYYVLFVIVKHFFREINSPSFVRSRRGGNSPNRGAIRKARRGAFGKYYFSLFLSREVVRRQVGQARGAIPECLDSQGKQRDPQSSVSEEKKKRERESRFHTSSYRRDNSSKNVWVRVYRYACVCTSVE